MNPNKLSRLFPQASAAFRRLNGGADAPEASRPDRSPLAAEAEAPRALRGSQVAKKPVPAGGYPSTDEAKLNKTERAFWECLKRTPGILLSDPQSVTLKLAFDCRLTPDFHFIEVDGQHVFVDVKGFQREDALIKMKDAARKYRWARFEITKKTKNGWDTVVVKP